MIELKNVSKWYGSFQVLNDCSTSIQKGEEVAVGTLVVNELILIRTVETSHSKQELGKLAGVMQEQGGSSILQLPIWSG